LRHNADHRWATAGILAVITLVGAVVLFLSPGRIGLRGDEAQFLAIAAMAPRSIISFLAQHESHPPLLYLVVHVLAGGQRPADAQITSFLVLAASIALIPAVFWLACLSARRSAGLLAAALTAASVPLAFFNVQLRPYAILSLLLVLSVCVLLRAVQTGAGRDRAIWTALALVMLYTHHIAVVFIAAEVMLTLALWLRRYGAAHAVRAWAPWYVAMAGLAVPDLLLLLYQARRTGIPSLAEAGWLMPLREFVRLLISFPFELLLPLIASLVLVVKAVRERDGGTARLGPAALSGSFILICLFFLASEYRRHILVDYVVLTVAPLGLAAVAVLLCELLNTQQRAAAGVVILGITALGTLSVLFAVGQRKTNIDVVAGLVQAEARADDIVLLAPRVSGVAFNRYFTRSNSQIDFPITGRAAVYRFDREASRIMDERAWASTSRSIRAARAAGRQIWYVFPGAWSDHAPSRADSVAACCAGSAAARVRGDDLGRLLDTVYGPATRTFEVRPAQWEQERFAVELYTPISGFSAVADTGGH
jgi:hypothetical protein